MRETLKGTHTYIDQTGVELYDNYDIKYEETPRMLLEATVIRESGSGKVVRINYPIVNGIWNLSGRAGSAPAFEEAGKKAFVRQGRDYKHPTKGWGSLITKMTPTEYIEACADLFSQLRVMYNQDRTKVTVEELIDTRYNDYDLNEVFDPVIGEIFYPMIDYHRNGQEGLHRAIWALMRDEESMPVIIIYPNET